MGGRYTLRVDARGGYAASGIIVEPQRVLTADHVVEREQGIEIVLPDGGRIPAHLRGRDPLADLALLATEERMGPAAEPASEGP